MGTRSTIALEFADSTVQQVYCHWDGYLSHNGRILFNSYSDPFKLQQLIDLGALSILGEEVSPTSEHSFEHAQKDVCVFYARDRGDELHKDCFDNFDFYQYSSETEEFNYVLRNNGVWYVRTANSAFEELSKAFNKETV
jgi:hypothetical protein